MNDQTLIFAMVLDVMRDTNRIGLYAMWEAIEALVYMYGDKEEKINQCHRPATNDVICYSCQNGELRDHTCFLKDAEGPSEFDLAVEEDEELGREDY